MHCNTCKLNITGDYFDHLRSDKHKKNYFYQAFEEEKEPILKIVDEIFNELEEDVNS